MALAFKDLGQLIIDSKATFAALEGAIPVFAGMVGSFFIFQGFIRAMKLGNNRGDVTPGQMFSSFIFGGMLLNYMQSRLVAMDMLGLSGGMSYTPNTGSAYVDQVISGVLFIVSVFGTIAIFNAILDAKKAGDGQRDGGDYVARALWKFVGGAIAINLSSFLS